MCDEVSQAQLLQREEKRGKNEAKVRNGTGDSIDKKLSSLWLNYQQ